MFFAATCWLGYADYFISDISGSFRREWAWEKGPNPSGKTGVEFKYCNGTGKTIRYLVFTCIPYNQVNDIVSCNVTGAVERRFKMTGPIEHSSYWQYAQFENGWSNPNISSVKLTKVEIQYMDGTTETLSERQLAANLRLGEQAQQQRKRKQEIENKQWVKEQMWDYLWRILIFPAIITGAMYGIFRILGVL